MIHTNSFTVLNASAGSGKTYSLVKQYITTLLISNSSLKFRHLLAITFTNKAVAEMKNRVLETLEDISNYSEGSQKPSMLDDLVATSGLSQEIVIKKATSILDHICLLYTSPSPRD